MEIGGGEEIIEIEMVKKRKLEQEKARMGEKMTKNERSDEKSSTLQLQTIREREIRVEHKIIQMKQENEEIWGPLH